MIENFILLSDIINKIYQVDVKEKNRVRKVQDLKKVFSLIAYEKIKGFRYTETGHFLKLTHATIIHQVKSAKNLLKYDNYFKEIYDRVEHEFLSLRKPSLTALYPLLSFAITSNTLPFSTLITVTGTDWPLSINSLVIPIFVPINPMLIILNLYFYIYT